MTIPIVIDSHLHLYPGQDLGKAVGHLRRNLALAAPGAQAVGILAERSDCHLFADLRRGDSRLLPPGWAAEPDPSGEALRLHGEGLGPVWLLPGRQVAACERIEILVLTRDCAIPDGLPARRVVTAALEADAIPVLAWAPGKWFFGRKRIVAGLLKEFGPQRLLLGDSSLRPLPWAEPLLMRQARREGFAVLAGSDPLPLAGEERFWGRYASRSTGEGGLDLDIRPAATLRNLLQRGASRLSPCGRRGGLLETLTRLRRNQAVRFNP